MKYLLLVLCLFVIACQTRFDLPKPVEYHDISRVSSHTNQHPISFEGLTIDLLRDQEYIVHPYWRFSFPDQKVGWSNICNAYPQHRFENSVVYWSSDQKNYGGWQNDVARYVEEPLLKMGYDIVSAKTSSFHQMYEKSRAELQFNATIVDLKINLCHLSSVVFLYSQKQAIGDAYAKVNWEIYDPLNKKVLGVITTEGVGYANNAVSDTQRILIFRALENAAENLGRNKIFHQYVMGKSSGYPYTDAAPHSWFDIEADKPLYNQGIEQDFTFIRRSVLTVRKADGHGSAFYINDEGYALTNYHVVGEAKTVSVIDFSGTAHMAEVIRVDRRRDVALIKTNVSNNPYIPLQLKKSPKMTEQVYAVGTPLYESLKTTVTQGIVSNFRKSSKTGLGMIQASVEIAPGSSGGPLLDKYGNVIGIAVEGYGQDPTQYGRFIPIKDALFALNIHIVKPAYP